MPLLPQLPKDASDAAIIAVIDIWAELLEAEDYEAAFATTEHDPAMRWTPVLIREVIQQYGDAKPGQKVTLVGKPTDISQRKEVAWFAESTHGIVGAAWYDLNINGFASDLTASFDIQSNDQGLSLVLNDIHVM